MDSGTVRITPWKRYGKHRLYVTAGEDTKVGFWDLLTDEGHPETPEQLTVLEQAVQDWKAAHAAEPSATPPAVAAGGVVRPWLDLTTNEAGAAAREQATAARAAAPVRTLLARARGKRTAERAWRIGADGEELVAAQLKKAAKKDPRWRSIHAVPVGTRASDIDHVIVGPGGVFTVNTKHHPRATIWVGGNTFMVNGHRQPYLRNSRHEAARAADRLGAVCGFHVHVEALIVTVNAAEVTLRSTPAGVHVVPRMHVARWLLRHGDIHDDQTVDTIYDAARRSTTWQPSSASRVSRRAARPG